MNKIALLSALMLLTACHTAWTPRSETTGELLEVAEANCRMKAEDSAARQIRYPRFYDYSIDGLPADSRHDIVARETAMCLEKRGFRLVSVDRYK